MGREVENGRRWREFVGGDRGRGAWKEISRSAKPHLCLREGGQFVQTNQENDPGDTFSGAHTTCMQAVEPSSCLVRTQLGRREVAKWQQQKAGEEEKKAGSIALGGSHVCSGHTHRIRISCLTISSSLMNQCLRNDWKYRDADDFIWLPHRCHGSFPPNAPYASLFSTQYFGWFYQHIAEVDTWYWKTLQGCDSSCG